MKRERPTLESSRAVVLEPHERQRYEVLNRLGHLKNVKQNVAQQKKKEKCVPSSLLFVWVFFSIPTTASFFSECLLFSSLSLFVFLFVFLLFVCFLFMSIRLASFLKEKERVDALKSKMTTKNKRELYRIQGLMKKDRDGERDGGPPKKKRKFTK